MNQIHKYFNAEKAESFIFFFLGIVAILLAIYFLLITKKPFFNGMSYPLIVIALIQITVGATIYFRTPKDIIRVENIIKNEPQKIETEELPRMKTVMKSFQTYFYVEIALLIIGLFLHFFCTKNMWLNGIGFGLILQCIAMLAADYFANARGKVYVEFLESLK